MCGVEHKSWVNSTICFVVLVITTGVVLINEFPLSITCTWFLDVYFTCIFEMKDKITNHLMNTIFRFYIFPINFWKTILHSSLSAFFYILLFFFSINPFSFLLWTVFPCFSIQFNIHLFPWTENHEFCLYFCFLFKSISLLFVFLSLYTFINCTEIHII